MGKSSLRKCPRVSSPMAEESSSACDVESPLFTTVASPTPPPPSLPSLRFRPTKSTPTLASETRRFPTYLGYSWHRRFLKAQSPPTIIEETAAVSETPTARASRTLVATDPRYAPASAHGISAGSRASQHEQQQIKPTWQGGGGGDSRSKAGSNRGRNRGYLKMMGGISLVFVLGMVALDLYVACLGWRGQTSSSMKTPSLASGMLAMKWNVAPDKEIFGSGKSPPPQMNNADRNLQVMGERLVMKPLRRDQYDGQRVAFVVAYVGRDVPAWWDVFVEQARLNDGLLDWIIFCDQKLVRRTTPPNVKFFPMSMKRLAWILAGVVELEDPELSHLWRDEDAHTVNKKSKPTSMDRPGNNDGLARTVSTRNSVKKSRTAFLLRQLLVKCPHCIMEFKPAFGWLFREYLTDYSHWAFGDLDVMFGDMRKGWLDVDELRDFDIITFSSGDQHRAYLRDQLTIHQNKPVVNNIWRRCSHLANYVERLEASRMTGDLPLESVEGCYSHAAASSPALRIKYTVKALSDVDEENEVATALTSGREVIVDHEGLVTLCPDLGYYDGPSFASGIYRAATVGREANDQVVPSMQDAVGPLTSVQRTNPFEEKCEPWIKLEHQTCVHNVGPRHTLFLLGGGYFKQEFINTAAASGGRGCRAGAFYHFKEHAKQYKSWNSHPPLKPAHSGLSVGKGGIVPLPAPGWRDRVSGRGFQPTSERTERVKHYCLEWVDQQHSRLQQSPSSEQVCATKVSSEEVIILVDTREGSTGNDENNPNAASTETVTLGSVGTPEDLESFVFDAMEWEGPKIFAMALDSEELATTRRMAILRGFKYSRKEVLIVVLPRPPTSPDTTAIIDAFPRKALMNLVLDLCNSRYLFSLPGFSHLSPNAFQAVTSHIRSNRSPSSSSRSMPTSRRQTILTSEIAPTRTSKTPGPITLVIPYDTARVGTLLEDHALAAAADAGAGWRGDDDYGVGSDSARRVDDWGGRPKTSSDTDPSLSTTGGMKSITTANAEVAAADIGDRPSVAALAPRISFTALAYGDTATELATSYAGNRSVGDGGVDSEEVRSGSNEKHVGLGARLKSAPSRLQDTTLRQEPHLAISKNDKGEGSEYGWWAKWTGWKIWTRWVKLGGGVDDEASTGAEKHESAVVHPGELQSAKTRRVKRYTYASDIGATETRGVKRGVERRSRQDVALELEEQEEAERTLNLIFSGPRMPGLVVDLWSPGSTFLRHVEEFGDLGCMDAAYALGLWKAGSTFEVVEATLTSTALSSSRSSQDNEYNKNKKAPLAREANELRVPGGRCLQREAVADTASIYSSFLQQVANIYGRQWSGTVERDEKRKHEDHWDLFRDER